MAVDDAAHHVASALQDEYPDSLYAVGWYDASRGERTGAVYISEAFEELGGRAPQVLGEALFDSLGRDLYERLHDEPLYCTTRVYDSLIDIDIPVSESSGIVIAIDPDAGNELMTILELSQTVTSVELGISPNASA